MPNLASASARASAASETPLSRRDLNKIAAKLFASALATHQYATSLDEGDEDRDLVFEQACAEKALYIRFCEAHGLRPASLAFSGCR